MKKILYLMIMIAASLPCFGMEVTRMTVEMCDSPLAVAAENPRFGWQLAGANGAMQSAYEIEILTSDGKKQRKVWTSGKVVSGKSQACGLHRPEAHADAALSVACEGVG